MVKRLRKNPGAAAQGRGGGWADSGGGWDAQQQATVAAYAHSRGMQPQEVLQALFNSKEKSLRKEKSGSLAGQTPSLNVSQRKEAGGKPEVQPWKREKRLEGKGSRTQLHCT
jgi:hypothetical protein